MSATLKVIVLSLCVLAVVGKRGENAQGGNRGRFLNKVLNSNGSLRGRTMERLSNAIQRIIDDFPSDGTRPTEIDNLEVALQDFQLARTELTESFSDLRDALRAAIELLRSTTTEAPAPVTAAQP